MISHRIASKKLLQAGETNKIETDLSIIVGYSSALAAS